jgi:hypothetical protein
MCSRLRGPIRGPSGLSWFGRINLGLDVKATLDNNLLLIRYLRFSACAINAFKSSGGRSMAGMLPAFIFAVGCLKSSASWSGENLAFMPISAGAAAMECLSGCGVAAATGRVTLP